MPTLRIGLSQRADWQKRDRSDKKEEGKVKEDEIGIGIAGQGSRVRGQPKFFIEETNRSILNRENFDETNRTSVRRNGKQLLNGLRPMRVTNYQEGS